MSAECFFTYLELSRAGALPPNTTIGLIQSAYSGTAMETWTPPEAFNGCPTKPWSGTGAALAAPGEGSAYIPDAPSCLWNSMINPIAGFGVQAILWNQGACPCPAAGRRIVSSAPATRQLGVRVSR